MPRAKDEQDQKVATLTSGEKLLLKAVRSISKHSVEGHDPKSGSTKTIVISSERGDRYIIGIADLSGRKKVPPAEELENSYHFHVLSVELDRPIEIEEEFDIVEESDFSLREQISRLEQQWERTRALNSRVQKLLEERSQISREAAAASARAQRILAKF